MERLNSFSTIELPPGFRFHPTDEELVTRYLSPKVLDSSFSSTAIGEVDLNKVEPWDLPWKAKMGEKEWYFFFLRDRKYPTGSRANRATDTGYWKATGKDKEIFQAKILVGMKKTLVFYRGRAPRGERTNWVMHEYRLHGKNSFHTLGKTDKSEWVICRVFKKSSGGKKVHISGLHRDEDRRLDLPSLMDMSFDENRTTTKDEGSHVTCYSNPPQDSLNNSFDEYISFANKKLPNSEYSFFSSHLPSCTDILNFSVMPDQTNASFIKQNAKTEFSEDMFKPYYHELGFKSYDEDQVFPTDDCLWNY